uniref:Uncharacterized protein n=1 Tax=Triticum urartu TaxID=4572 RepID=A0A8R7JUN9_TRIUA
MSYEAILFSQIKCNIEVAKSACIQFREGGHQPFFLGTSLARFKNIIGVPNNSQLTQTR